MSFCRGCGNAETDMEDGLCGQCRSIDAATLPPSAVTLPPHSDSKHGSVASRNSGPTMTPGSGPTDFGEYELLAEVARGGMGVIYKARHRKLNRVTALKMILSGRFSSDAELQRFHIEAEAAAKLDHPGIVPVYEIGECDGQAFFAMKYIEGGSLAEAVQRLSAEPRHATQILAKVARAVHHAHQRGILHRDLKPANILLDGDDEPLITDLGLAKDAAGDSNLTRTGAVLGTPSYMPPEQASGDDSITTAVDIYSIGAMMYELLTGQPPHKGDSPMDTVMQVLKGPPESPHKKCPNVDRDLEAICMNCLQHDPAERYDSADDLATDLEAWLAGRPLSVKPPSTIARAASFFRANQRLVYIGFAVLAGMFVTVPFALALLSSGERGISDVYSRFPANQRPWIFSHGSIPETLSMLSAGLLIFVFWPAVGWLNALVSRSKSTWHSALMGVVTSLILVGVFFLLLGWLPFTNILSNKTDQRIGILTEAIWTPEGKPPMQTREAANSLFDGLDKIAVKERARVVTKRLAADRLAAASEAAFELMLSAGVLCLPFVFGTVIAHILLARGNWWWVCLLRYSIIWWLLVGVFFITLGCILGGPSINGVPLRESPWTLVLVGVALLIAFLVGRRWRKTPNPISERSEASSSLSEDTILHG